MTRPANEHPHSATGAQRDLPVSGMDFGGTELRAFYDLNVHPVTYDVGTFLAHAEAVRVKSGCSHIRIYVVPDVEGGGNNKAVGHSADHSLHRVSNIILPALRCLPTCTGVSVLADRASALDLVPENPDHAFPVDFRLDRPTRGYLFTSVYRLAEEGVDLQPLQAPADKHAQVHRWLERHDLDGKRLVAITLREANYQIDRNSNLEAWGDFCAFLTRQGLQPVILRDFDVMYDPIPEELAGYPLCDVANWDLGFRLALYERADLSLSVNNGPQVMSFFNKNVDFMVVKWVTETVNVTSTAFRLKNRDRLDKDLSFLSGRQHIVWENDDLAVLVKNYQRFFGQAPDVREASDSPSCSLPA